VIDLVACHNGRYALFDYKTNRLPSYDQASLAETMVAHHYLLQGLLYALAWDAHLRHLLPDYRPEVDLPDVHFLFVRGMATGKEQGIFTCRFSPATLAAARQALGIADGTDR
jgi:exodeoxyribonuclease V beta subunit